MALTIRPAEAQDGNQAVPLIYSSGPEAFDYCFADKSGSALPFLQNVFPTGKGFFGYTNHHVAVIEGQVVGTIALYSATEYQRMSNETLKQALGLFPFWHWPRVISHCLKIGHWMPAPGKHMDYVANLGVAPERRSQGIGKAMLDYGLDYARKRNKTVYALDVADINPRAEALYSRYGFAVTGTQTSIDPSMPGAKRMEMPLIPEQAPTESSR